MIYLIRHGQTDENLAWRIQGQRDFPLNATGEAQAEEVKDKLRNLGISFARVYSSPLGRAVRTAEIVTGCEGSEALWSAKAPTNDEAPTNEKAPGSAEAPAKAKAPGSAKAPTSAEEPAKAKAPGNDEAPANAEAPAGASTPPAILIDDRLIEMNYGPYEGADLKDLPEALKEFFSDFVHNPAPEGMEQLPDLVARLGAFLEDVKPELESLGPGVDVLLSTHAIAMKAALEYLTPGSNGAYWSKFLPNCGIYRFELRDGVYTVPEEFLTE